MDVMEQQTDALDLHTNALQILLGEALLLGLTQLLLSALTPASGLCRQRRLCCSAPTWPRASAC